ncbi:TPA_asm: N-acetyltransferase [Listeria monocytogenes]|nr:N-acetyltransferase [Listeria monocytogenes]HAC3614362.1 N-acetyltransferase [Listeria monocytogenes]HAC3675883.1 N-acetyltransferase [Listeria monocytogenes]HAC3696574.1 N-acetyltransferase [Listeria monocytogenes]
MTRDKEFDVSTYSVVEYVGDLNKETFDCHNHSINNFLYKESREFNLSNLANTTIVYDNKEKRILGFYTLNAGVIEFTRRNDKFVRHSPGFDGNTMFADGGVQTYPVIHLAYIALNKEYQRNNEYRYGTQLLKQVFEVLICDIKERIGFSALKVSALSESVDFYLRNGFEYVYYKPEMCDIKEYDMFIRYNRLKEGIIKS